MHLNKSSCTCSQYAENNLNTIKLNGWNDMGFTDEQRSIHWKLLLCYLPIDKPNEWHSIMEEKIRIYSEFLEEVIDYPQSSPAFTKSDHPLNTDPDSQWNIYFRDNELLAQISTDCRRLHPKIDFFHRQTDNTILNSNNLAERLRFRMHKDMVKSSAKLKFYNGFSTLQLERQPESVEITESGEKHWEVITRLIFVFTKLNPAQPYIQGLNEIVAPLYHVFVNGSHHPEMAEIDCFFCLMLLMSRIRDNFTTLRSYRSDWKEIRNDETYGIKRCQNWWSSSTLDQKHTVLNASVVHEQLRQVEFLLSTIDLPIYKGLNDNKILIEYYAFRWIMLMFAQEFELADLLIIWDVILCVSLNNHNNFITSIACALILSKRAELLTYLQDSNFSQAMKLLQNMKPDPKIVLRLAKQLSSQWINILTN
ncbi:hypothetical protein GJ496_007236 [Pomphorhynchus laevis]|nr:hypothetical protein GJ496_007236 [Pomphorhynchus laevis]